MFGEGEKFLAQMFYIICTKKRKKKRKDKKWKGWPDTLLQCVFLKKNEKKKAFKLERLLTTALPLYCVPEYKWYTSDPSVLNKMLILDLVTGLNFFFSTWDALNVSKIPGPGVALRTAVQKYELVLALFTIKKPLAWQPAVSGEQWRKICGSSDHRRKTSSHPGIDYTEAGICKSHQWILCNS